MNDRNDMNDLNDFNDKNNMNVKKEMTLIDLLRGPYMTTLVRKLNICEGKIIRTRNQATRSTSRCSFWQFNYSVIYYFYFMKIKFTSATINNMCQIISQFTTNANINSPLSKIIHYNHATDENVVPINNPNVLTRNEMHTQNYYMCIYNTMLGTGSILHFFTIIREGDDYYLNSSYGSDYVCVPQYTTKLNIEEFYGFCYALINKNNKGMITYFFEKYFMKGNLQKRYDENTTEEIPALKNKWIEPSAGTMKEIDYFFVESNNYSVGLLPSYNELSYQIIQEIGYSLNGGKRIRNKRSNKKRKNKSSKKKQTKNKKKSSKKKKHTKKFKKYRKL